jgi:hypothetical protein
MSPNETLGASTSFKASINNRACFNRYKLDCTLNNLMVRTAINATFGNAKASKFLKVALQKRWIITNTKGCNCSRRPSALSGLNRQGMHRSIFEPERSQKHTHKIFYGDVPSCAWFLL